MMIAIKFAIAGGATALLGLIALARTRPALARRLPVDFLLVCLALAAFGAWWNLGRFHSPIYWHRHEFFHYYLGAKYPELGYTRLYECTAAAEIDSGAGAAVANRWTRNLETNTIEAGARAARNPSLCRDHFSASRWEAFKRDVLWFRTTVSPEKWARMQLDHGYNATPVWTLSGYLLANTGPASTTRVVALALIDPALLVAMWGAAWWAFGWRATAVAIIWWGTNYPARFTYIGGAFLRADWLFLFVASLALAKRARFAGSGVAFATATLLRVFPGFAAGGLALQQLPNLFSRDRWPGLRATLQFAAAAAATVVVLLLVSGVFFGGSLARAAEPWTAFAENSRKHLSGTSTNRVGLKTVISFDYATRYNAIAPYWIDNPGDVWQAARQRVFSERRVLYWAIVAAFIAVLFVAVRNQPEWIALVLGIGLIPMVSEMTGYYYSILLGYAFLWPRYPWVGVGLSAFAAYSSLVALTISAEDIQYAAFSVGLVLFVIAVTAGVAWAGRVRHQEAADTAVAV